MRVLLVNDRAPAGASGTEVHLAQLVSALSAAGDDVRVFTRAPRSGAAALLDVWDPWARRALVREIQAFRPDVLHVHNVVRELSVAVLTAWSGPTVLTVHDGRLLGDADGQGAALRAYQRAHAPFDAAVSRRRSHVVLAVSGPLAVRLSGAGFARVRHSPLWADSPVAQPVPVRDCHDVAFLGRLDPDKGVEVLLGAAEALHNGRVLLAGEGRDWSGHPAVRSGKAVLLGRLGRVEVSRLLGTSRAVVLPSLPARRPEGAPLVLLEALVHGRPLVVSDDPGMVELTAAGSAGVVVPAGDARGLAAALARLLADDDVAEALAAGARAAAGTYSVEAGLARVRTAYAEAVAVCA